MSLLNRHTVIQALTRDVTIFYVRSYPLLEIVGKYEKSPLE